MQRLLSIGVWCMALLLPSLFTSSCTKTESTDYSDLYQTVFDDWMAQYYPELLDNRQDSGYYIDIISVGDNSGAPIADTVCWVKYDITCRDLHGNVTLTRNSVYAWQQGSYTNFTHYTPYYRINDESISYGVSEATYHAMCNKLAIASDSTYLYSGAKFKIYMPATLIGTGGSGSAGYDGQYTLDTSRPMIAHVKITEMTTNPIELETGNIDAFAANNGGTYNTYISPDEWEGDEDESPYTSDDDDLQGNFWQTANDTIPHVYISKAYVPLAGQPSFNYSDSYETQVPISPYVSGVNALDAKINDALLERFGEGVLDGDIIDESTAKIWYVVRFLNGFIIDTNIEEVRELIYGSDDTSTSFSALSFTSTTTGSYIDSWYETIPQFRFGQWAALITNSTYAYGESGVAGSVSTSTSGSSSYDYSSYYDYYDYYNSYYGYSSYDYYNSMYGYNYNSNYSTGETTTTISTEIPPYTPLIFQIYIEELDE